MAEALIHILVHHIIPAATVPALILGCVWWGDRYFEAEDQGGESEEEKS